MSQDPGKPSRTPFNLMLLVVGLLVFLPAAGCTMPFLAQMIGAALYSSGSPGALDIALLLVVLGLGGGTMALGAWLVYLALPHRR